MYEDDSAGTYSAALVGSIVVPSDDILLTAPATSTPSRRRNESLSIFCTHYKDTHLVETCSKFYPKLRPPGPSDCTWMPAILTSNECGFSIVSAAPSTTEVPVT